jgi:hypothetical protein
VSPLNPRSVAPWRAHHRVGERRSAERAAGAVCREPRQRHLLRHHRAEREGLSPSDRFGPHCPSRSGFTSALISAPVCLTTRPVCHCACCATIAREGDDMRWRTPLFVTGRFLFVALCPAYGKHRYYLINGSGPKCSSFQNHCALPPVNAHHHITGIRRAA